MTHEHHHPASTFSSAFDPASDEWWDARYSTDPDRIWSGEPNGALVREAADLAPGRALDVGCGEGADAVWLATRGWDVTAIDVSPIALARAATHAERAGVTVRFVHAGLLTADLAPGGFELVSAQYPALLRTPEYAAERALLAAVAPRGEVLVVHHAGVDRDQALANGFDPDDFVSPADVAARLDGDWEVLVDETRPRTISGGAGGHHADDVVLRARRASSAG